MSRSRRRVAKRRAPEPRTARAVRRGPVATVWREIALALSCLLIAILLLALDPSLRNVFDLTKAAYSHAVAWVLLAALVMVAASDGLRVPRSPLFLAFYVAIAVEVLATATATNGYVALYGEVGRYLGLTTHLVLALLAIGIAAGLEYPRRASWLAWSLAAASVVALAYGALQAMNADPIRWSEVDIRHRPFATLGNPDFYGQFLSASVVGWATIALFSSVPRVRFASGALGAASMWMLILTTTRGALIGVIAGAIVLGVLWTRRSGWTRSTLARIGLAGVAFAVGVGIVVLTTQLGNRLISAFDLANVQDRVLIYTAATRIFLDHPVLGVGFENFAVAYPAYGEAEGLWGNRTQTSAHNWILHLAATTGTVGLVAMVGLISVLAIHVWRRARDPDATPLLASAGALAAFYASGLVLPGAQSIQWIPWACLGVALSSDLRSAPDALRFPPLRLPLLARIAVVVALAVMAATQATVIEANRLAKTAETTLRAESARRSVDAARAAIGADPGRAVYWNDLGRALELVDDQEGARRAYVEATTRSPYTPAFWWNLGRMHLFFALRGDTTAKADALAAFQHALDASPRNPDTYDQLARAQLALGDLADALASGERAIALYPYEARFYDPPADAAREMGETDRSLDILRRGVRDTGSTTLRLTLARRLITVRAITEARTLIDEVLRSEPENATAQELRRQTGAP